MGVPGRVWHDLFWFYGEWPNPHPLILLLSSLFVSVFFFLVMLTFCNSLLKKNLLTFVHLYFGPFDSAQSFDQLAGFLNFRKLYWPCVALLCFESSFAFYYKMHLCTASPLFKGCGISLFTFWTSIWHANNSSWPHIPTPNFKQASHMHTIHGIASSLPLLNAAHAGLEGLFI